MSSVKFLNTDPEFSYLSKYIGNNYEGDVKCYRRTEQKTLVPNVGKCEVNFKGETLTCVFDVKHELGVEKCELIITGKLETIVQFIDHIENSINEEVSFITYSPSSYIGRFDTTTKQLPMISAANVYIPEDTVKNLLNDVDEFCSDAVRKWFKRNNAVWRRVYHLEGNDQEIKQDIIQLLASHLKCVAINCTTGLPSEHSHSNAIKYVMHKPIVQGYGSYQLISNKMSQFETGIIIYCCADGAEPADCVLKINNIDEATVRRMLNNMYPDAVGVDTFVTSVVGLNIKPSLVKKQLLASKGVTPDLVHTFNTLKSVCELETFSNNQTHPPATFHSYAG